MAIYSVIGLELTEKFFIVSQINSENNTPYVSLTKAAPMPPKVISDGVITDPELLAEHLLRIIQELGITSLEMIVSVPDQTFVKALEKFPIMKSQDLLLELQMKVANHRYFSRGDFQLGYQIFKEPSSGKEAKNYQSVLYAAVTQSQIDSLNQLSDAMGINLVAIDLPGLAAIRCMQWRRPTTPYPCLYLFLDNSYLDCYIIWHDSIVFTQSIYIDELKFTESPDYSGTVIERLTHFLLSYSDKYPHFEPVSYCWFASRSDEGDFLFEKISASFPDIQCSVYNPTDSISINSVLSPSGERPNFVESVVSIGLALKYFEKTNQTLSLTKLKKRFNPVIDKKQFGIAMGVLCLCFLICKTIQLYISHNTSMIGKNVQETQNAISALQSGEFLTRQKQLEAYQERIKSFAAVRQNNYPRYELMKMLSEGIPNDVTIQSFSISEAQKGEFKASAYYQDSIFIFYEKLKTEFNNVVIGNISTQSGNAGASENDFHITFVWERK